MSSQNSSDHSSGTKKKTVKNNQLYGHGIVDNGSKWGSTVTRNEDGSIPFDEALQRTDPERWNKMMSERIGPLYNTMMHPVRKIKPKWANGLQRQNY